LHPVARKIVTLYKDYHLASSRWQLEQNVLAIWAAPQSNPLANGRFAEPRGVVVGHSSPERLIAGNSSLGTQLLIASEAQPADVG
jgi:hypothetical protein